VKGIACAALGAAMALASGSVWPSQALAHNLGKDSVDCTLPFDCEIRWVDHTRFGGPRRFGISQWNRLGRVDIVPDNVLTIADLEFIDYRDCAVTWDAFWAKCWAPTCSRSTHAT
jgi:hypothetical protein